VVKQGGWRLLSAIRKTGILLDFSWVYHCWVGRGIADPPSGRGSRGGINPGSNPTKVGHSGRARRHNRHSPRPAPTHCHATWRSSAVVLGEVQTRVITGASSGRTSLPCGLEQANTSGDRDIEAADSPGHRDGREIVTIFPR